MGALSIWHYLIVLGIIVLGVYLFCRCVQWLCMKMTGGRS